MSEKPKSRRKELLVIPDANEKEKSRRNGRLAVERIDGTDVLRPKIEYPPALKDLMGYDDAMDKVDWWRRGEGAAATALNGYWLFPPPGLHTLIDVHSEDVFKSLLGELVAASQQVPYTLLVELVGNLPAAPTGLAMEAFRQIVRTRAAKLRKFSLVFVTTKRSVPMSFRYFTSIRCTVNHRLAARKYSVSVAKSRVLPLSMRAVDLDFSSMPSLPPVFLSPLVMDIGDSVSVARWSREVNRFAERCLGA